MVRDVTPGSNPGKAKSRAGPLITVCSSGFESHPRDHLDTFLDELTVAVACTMVYFEDPHHYYYRYSRSQCLGPDVPDFGKEVIRVLYHYYSR